MRELNECTAEVFRRGEQRIRERRRKRSRILAVCIPFCLIAVVWSAMSLPAGRPEGEDRLTGEAAENAGMNLFCPYTEVGIQDAGIFPEHCEEVTDLADVAEMFRAIHALFAEFGGNGQTVSGSFPVFEDLPAAEDDENHDLTESTGKAKGYTITFTTEEGAQAVYHLNEKTLVNTSTNETVFLSDAQAAGLLAVLGILE